MTGAKCPRKPPSVAVRSLDPKPVRVERCLDSSNPYECGMASVTFTSEGVRIEGPDRADWSGTWLEFMAWVRAIDVLGQSHREAEEVRGELARVRAQRETLDRLRAIGEGRVALQRCPVCQVDLRLRLVPP